jgi:hypothetical protein
MEKRGRKNREKTMGKTQKETKKTIIERERERDRDKRRRVKK